MKMGSPRTIHIPEWMNSAISELAVKHNRDMESEIEYLVKAAIRHAAETGHRSTPAASRAESAPGEKE
jgi:hypothetical protein